MKLESRVKEVEDLLSKGRSFEAFSHKKSIQIPTKPKQHKYKTKRS
jgi:hypothetical protein